MPETPAADEATVTAVLAPGVSSVETTARRWSLQRDECDVERDEVANAVNAVQASLSGAFSCMVDAHNALNKRMQDARKQINPLLEDNDKLFNRMKHVEAQQISVAEDIRVEISNNGSFYMQELKSRADELRNMQDRVRQDLTSVFEQRLSESLEKQALELEKATAPLEKRVHSLEVAQERLAHQQSFDHGKMENELRLLRSDLEKTCEVLAAGMTKIEEQDGCLKCLGASRDAHLMKLDELATSFRTCAIDSSFQELVARVDELQREVLQNGDNCDSMKDAWEGRLFAVQEAMKEQLNQASEEMWSQARAEAAAMRESVSNKEGNEIKDLEMRMEQAVKDHQAVVDAVDRHARVAANDTFAAREWVSKRLASLAEHLKQIEDSQRGFELSEKDVRRVSNQLLLGDGDGLLRRLEDLGSRTSVCAEEVDRVRLSVSSMKPVLDQVVNTIGMGNWASVTTTCLSCGAQPSGTAPIIRWSSAEHMHRPTSARTRSQSPSTICEDTASCAGTASTSRVFTGGFKATYQSRGNDPCTAESSVSSVSTSAPTSATRGTGQTAGKLETAYDAGDAFPAGAAHAAARAAAAGPTPGPSPRSSLASGSCGPGTGGVGGAPSARLSPPLVRRPNSARARLGVR